MAFRWCVVKVPVIPGRTKGAIVDAARWSKGTMVRIGFTDGSDDLRDRVFEVGQEWLSRTGADLKFFRRNKPEDADVRISFAQSGSWSMLGNYAANERGVTMNFGDINVYSSAEDVRQVVLHEFGHMMGFMHEHQNPLGGLKWKEDVVIAELAGGNNNWSIRDIRENVLNQPDPRTLRGTPFDPHSIMLYPFPAEWNENGIATKANKDLSPTDIALARNLYA